MNTLQGSFSPSKKPQKHIAVDNPIESLKDVGTGVVEAVKESSAEAVKDMWAQILGVERSKASTPKGDLKAGQEVNLKDIAKKKEQTPQTEAPMNYFREIAEAGRAGMRQETAEIHQQVQSIMYELQRLATVSKTIERQVASAIGTGYVKPGKYHANFFDWMLTVVADARKRVENAGAWLYTVKKKKGFVQGMKKNMSQLMSGERSVSNQTA